MSDILIISIILLAIAALLAVASCVAVLRPRANSRGNFAIDLPWFGKVTTNIPAMGVATCSLVLAFLVYSLWIARPVDLIEFDGTASIDPAALDDVDAIVIGITSGNLQQTLTPDRNSGAVAARFPVPNSWQSYTAYAFAYGNRDVRPVVVGVDLRDPKFNLDLKP